MLAAPVDLKDPGAMGCSAGSLLLPLGLEKSDFRSFDQDGIDNGRLYIQGPLSSGPQKTGRLFRGLNLELGFFPGIHSAVQRLH